MDLALNLAAVYVVIAVLSWFLLGQVASNSASRSDLMIGAILWPLVWAKGLVHLLKK